MIKNRTKLLCKKTVVVDTGVQCFTEGKVYHTYKYSYIEGWDRMVSAICVKNDHNERHIIINLTDGDTEFFNEVFEIIK